MSEKFRVGTLGEIACFKNGKSVKANHGKVPIYGGNGILGYYSNSNFENTVVIGRVGAHCGSVHLEKGKCWVSDNAIACLPKINVYNSYNYYLLKALKLNSHQVGSSQPLLTQDILSKIKLKIEFDYNKQKKIASVLSSIDDKITLNNWINAKLEAMAKILYDYWFVQFDFPDANGKPYKSSGGKMVYNETLKRDIPAGWEDTTLESLGRIVGGSTPSTKDSENFTDLGIPWITPNDLSKNAGNKFISRGAIDVSNKGFKSASLKKYPKGTVLLSSRAPIGYIAIARNEVTTNQGFKSFIPTKGYSTEFIYFAIKNSLKAITQYASGSTFKEISGTVLKTVKIELSKNNLTNEFTEKVKNIFKRQNLLEQENEQLCKLRDWLLPMLMNGQVVVK